MTAIRPNSLVLLIGLAATGCSKADLADGADATVDASADDGGCTGEFIRADYTLHGIRRQSCTPLPHGIRVDVDFAGHPLEVAAEGFDTDPWPVVSVIAQTATFEPLPFVTSGTFTVGVVFNAGADVCGGDSGGCRFGGMCNLVVAEAAPLGSVGAGHITGPCTIQVVGSNGVGEIHEIAIRGTLTPRVRDDHSDAGR